MQMKYSSLNTKFPEGAGWPHYERDAPRRDYLSNDHWIFLCLITEHIRICNSYGVASLIININTKIPQIQSRFLFCF